MPEKIREGAERMRPIDADEAHSKLTELYKNAQGEARKAYSAALDIISDADTIEKPLTIPDVERVLNEATVFSVCFHERITLREFMDRVQQGKCNRHRRGRWIEEYQKFGTKHHCSVCQKPIYVGIGISLDVTSFSFCPNCGAKMDADGGGTDAGD